MTCDRPAAMHPMRMQTQTIINLPASTLKLNLSPNTSFFSH